MLEDLLIQLREAQATTCRYDDPSGIMATFELSWQALDQEAQILGCLLSIFATAPISSRLMEQIFEAQSTPDFSEKIRSTRDGLDIYLNQLTNKFLLQVTRPNTFALHELVRDCFRQKLETLEIADYLKSLYCRGIVITVSEIDHTSDVEAVERLIPLVPHVVECATALRDWLTHEDFQKPFDFLGNFYVNRNIVDQSEVWRNYGINAHFERVAKEIRTVSANFGDLARFYNIQQINNPKDSSYQLHPFEQIIQDFSISEEILDNGQSLEDEFSFEAVTGTSPSKSKLSKKASEQDVFDQVLSEILGNDNPYAAPIISAIQRTLRQYHLTDQYEAHEILHEAYLRGKKKLQTGGVIRNPYAWLRVTAFQVIYEHKRKHRSSATDPQVMEAVLPDNRLNLMQQQLLLEELDLLYEAMTMLHKEDPEGTCLLYLRTVQNWSWSQISQWLAAEGQSLANETALRQRASRAKRRLRDISQQCVSQHKETKNNPANSLSTNEFTS